MKVTLSGQMPAVSVGVDTRPSEDGRACLHVLSFHRLPIQRDAGELTLEEFEFMLDRLSRTHPVMSLGDGVDAVKEGRLDTDALALTFDDGYVDWVDGLVPALAQRGMSGTLFLCTDPLLGRPLWFERLRALVRSPLPAPPWVREMLGRQGLDPRDPKLEEGVKRLSAQARNDLLGEWEHRLGDERPHPRAALFPSHLRDFHRLGFDIGAHTCSHPILADCTEQEAWDEITRGRAELEALVPGLRVRGFAYPNGRSGRDWGPREQAMVRAAGFDHAVSTDRGATHAWADRWALPRVPLWRGRAPGLVWDLLRSRKASKRMRSQARPADAGAEPALTTNRPVVAHAPSPARPQALACARQLDAAEQREARGHWMLPLDPEPGQPQVSVVIPAWNASAWLDEAIESVLAQEGVTLEVLVINDGSTDGDYQRFANGRPEVRVIDVPNGGVARARNIGIELARAPLIAFLDADDVWCPGKLTAQLQVLRERPAAGLVFGAYRRWPPRASGRHEPWRDAATGVVSPRINPEADGWLYGRLMQGLLLGTGGVLMRRELAVRLGGFDTSLRLGEDHDLWLRSARQAPLVGLADPTFLYRSNERGLTASLSTVDTRSQVLEMARLRHGLAAPHSSGTTATLLERELASAAFDHGWSHFWKGSAARARQAFRRAARAHPRSPRLWLYLLLLTTPGALPMLRWLRGETVHPAPSDSLPAG